MLCRAGDPPQLTRACGAARLLQRLACLNHATRARGAAVPKPCHAARLTPTTRLQPNREEKKTSLCFLLIIQIVIRTLATTFSMFLHTSRNSMALYTVESSNASSTHHSYNSSKDYPKVRIYDINRSFPTGQQGCPLGLHKAPSKCSQIPEDWRPQLQEQDGPR